MEDADERDRTDFTRGIAGVVRARVVMVYLFVVDANVPDEAGLLMSI